MDRRKDDARVAQLMTDCAVLKSEGEARGGAVEKLTKSLVGQVHMWLFQLHTSLKTQTLLQ